MIIRVSAIVSLVATMILFLYVPSQRSPYFFVHQIQIEHARNVQFWGRATAFGVLARTLDASPSVPESAPLMGPGPRTAPARSVGGALLQREMSGMGARITTNSYLLSMNALLLLATYRLLFMLAFLPAFGAFLAACVSDGAWTRVIRSRLFQQHNPEMFALYASMVIVLLCSAVVACVLPTTLHPALIPACPFVIAIFVCKAIGHYHRRVS